LSSFRFLHAADLHLGSPFRGLALKDAGIARRFADATRSAFETLVSRAIEEAVDFVVIAGDVYDGEWKDNAIGLFFNRQIARLDRAGIPVFMLRGNHDAESVVTRSVPLPDSVRQFSTKKAEVFELPELRVALHGRGFPERSTSENLAIAYPAPIPGWFNIGVLHTSLSGRPNHADYAPCTIEDLRGRDYDYWALGHVHEYEIVHTAPHIVFPGNLQGRSVREAGAKGAVLVSVVDGRVAALERLLVDEARWHIASVTLAGDEDVPGILKLVEGELQRAAAAADGRLLAVRLRLDGVSAHRSRLVATRADLLGDLQAVANHIGEEIWIEKLEFDLADPPTGAEEGAADIAALLEPVLHQPTLAEEAAALIRDIAARLPGGTGDALAAEADALIAEARDILLDRARR
jgi:predicted phosphodiesterase